MRRPRPMPPASSPARGRCDGSSPPVVTDGGRTARPSLCPNRADGRSSPASGGCNRHPRTSRRAPRPPAIRTRSPAQGEGRSSPTAPPAACCSSGAAGSPSMREGSRSRLVWPRPRRSCTSPTSPRTSSGASTHADASTTLAAVPQVAAVAVVRGGTLYAVAIDGPLVRISPTGGVTRIAPGLDRPHGVTVDRDGTLLVAEDSTRVRRVDPANGRSEIVVDGVARTGSQSRPTARSTSPGRRATVARCGASPPTAR